jgi:hypothetical protein
MHMRKSVILLAALLTATPALAAEQCLKLKNGGFDYGDTAHCFVRIDGHVIINRTCHYGVSGDRRVWAIDGVAEVWMEALRPDRPLYGYSCQAKKCSTWPNDAVKPGDPGSGLANYGRVDGIIGLTEDKLCWGNKRFRLCFSPPYLICDPETRKAFEGCPGPAAHCNDAATQR